MFFDGYMAAPPTITVFSEFICAFAAGETAASVTGRARAASSRLARWIDCMCLSSRL